MPPASDRVRKEKKDKNKANRKGTEIVSDSDIGTPGRSRGPSDALMDLQEEHEAQAFCTQEHAGRDSVQGQAMVVPPNTHHARTEFRKPSFPRTEADDEPITKSDLATMQRSLALMLQNAVAEGVQSLQRTQEKQGARLSALEESNRALTEKVKQLEGKGPPRSGSVPAARSSLFAPSADSGGGVSANARSVSVHDKRTAPESADATERRSRQCLLSGFKERLTLGEFKVLIPTLVDKHGKKAELPQNVSFSSYELFSHKVRLEFATEWDRRTYASAFIAGQPKHKEQPVYCNRILDKQSSWRSWMVREARRYICSNDNSLTSKLRICPRAHILYNERRVAFFIARDEKPTKDCGWPPGIPFDEFLVGVDRGGG
eukprot:228957-Amphidinium_carterae.1